MERAEAPWSPDVEKLVTSMLRKCPKYDFTLHLSQLKSVWGFIDLSSMETFVGFWTLDWVIIVLEIKHSESKIVT